MRLPFLFVLATVMIDAMGIGLILPIMPDLINEVQGGTLADAAIWGGILSSTFAVLQFLFGPILGNLSDAFGRRPVILVSLFIMALDYLVMAVAGSIWLLLIGRIVGGITAATHSTAAAFMADVSRPEEKAQNFGLLGAAFGVGFVLGPLLGGALSGMGTRVPFYAAAGLVGLNWILGMWVMPETVTRAMRRPFRWRDANPFSAFRAMTRIRGISALLWVYFLYSVAIYVYPSIWAFFTKAQFGWSAQMIGLSLGLYGIAIAVVQGGLLRYVTRWCGEWRTVILGQAFEIAAFAVLAFITSGFLALMFVPITALGAVVTPALQAILSKSVPDNRQGELQGVMTAVHSLSMVISPLMMTWVFARATDPAAPVHLPGAPFLLALVLMLIGLVILLRNRPGLSVRDPA